MSAEREPFNLIEVSDLLTRCMENCDAGLPEDDLLSLYAAMGGGGSIHGRWRLMTSARFIRDATYDFPRGSSFNVTNSSVGPWTQGRVRVIASARGVSRKTRLPRSVILGSFYGDYHTGRVWGALRIRFAAGLQWGPEAMNLWHYPVAEAV